MSDAMTEATAELTSVQDVVPVTLTVLTFNLWGIFNAKLREERMAHFASKVASYDIILLQEQFTAEDFELIRANTPDEVRATRYFRRFPSSFYGSGCAVISRFPIRSALFYTFPLQGLPEMVLHGDFFANKGAALVKVDVPVTINGVCCTKEVLLYTTHLVAVYQKISCMSDWRCERYLPYRISQAIALADFVTSTSRPQDAVIIGGDFNSSQRSLEVQLVRILLKRRGYQLRSVLPAPSVHFAATSDEAAMNKPASMLYTFSNQNAFNAMSSSYFKLLNFEADLPNQIDHLFFTANAFTLTSFADCPDVSPNFPHFRREDGTRQTTGVVVFTNNEVAPAARVTGVPYHRNVLQRLPGLLGRGAVSLLSQVFYLVNGVRTLLRPCGRRACAAPQSRDSAVFDNIDYAGVAFRQHRFPLSDHYGVAARLTLWVRAANTTTAEAAAGDAPPPTPVSLTQEELSLLNTVCTFLEQHCAKLRHQVILSRYITGCAAAVLLANVALMFHASMTQQRCTARAMQNIYEMSNGQTTLPQPVANAARADRQPSPSQPPSLQSDTKRSVVVRYAGAATGWVTRTLLRRPATQPAPASALVLFEDDFQRLACEMGSPLSRMNIILFSTVNMVMTLLGFTSFSIGMFQRIGNAHILGEQLRCLREV